MKHNEAIFEAAQPKAKPDTRTTVYSMAATEAQATVSVTPAPTKKKVP